MAAERIPISPSSDDLSSITETIGTVSSSSTVWGPGALTGKALKAFGETSLDFFCTVIIRRRLTLIRQTLDKNPGVLTNPSSTKEWRQRDTIYADLDELLCRGVYPLSLRCAAVNLLKDIVSLISRSITDHIAHDFEYSVTPRRPTSVFSVLTHTAHDFEYSVTPRRLTSVFSAPTHTPWASLLSHLQRYDPLLFVEQGPFINVKRWNPGMNHRESDYWQDDADVESDAYMVDLPIETFQPEIKPIIVSVTVEVIQCQDIQNDPAMIKASALDFRSRLSKTLQSQNQHDRTSPERIISETQDAGQPTGNHTGPSMRHGPKVLVLGAGGVGKSTILHQFQANLGNLEWCRDLVPADVIINNTIASMRSLLLNSPVSDLHPSLLEARRHILELPAPSFNVDMFCAKELEDVGRAIRSLWQDPKIRKTAQTRRVLLGDDLFVAPDSLEYFCESVDRIFTGDYIPTLHDILRARVRTIGVHEMTLKTESIHPMCFIDIGGERSQRKKWSQYYGDAIAVLFVVALSDYSKPVNDVLSPHVSQMDVSLSIFDDIVNSPRLVNALITLIFNKCDVFEKELEVAPLYERMPDYAGKTYDEACKHIENRFTKLVKDKNRGLHIHYTTAIDEKAMFAKSAFIRDEITRDYQRQRED